MTTAPPGPQIIAVGSADRNTINVFTYSNAGAALDVGFWFQAVGS